MAGVAITIRISILAGLAAGAVLPCAAQTGTAIGKEPSADENRASRESGPDSHGRMVGLLEEIRRRSAAENLYTGVDFRARERRQLELLGSDATDAQRSRLLLVVGKDELRLGNNRNAIELLLKAHELSDSRLVQPVFQLAVAYLRLGEASNCIAHRNADSCILPLRGGGIHRDQRPARTAIGYLIEVLPPAAGPQGGPVAAELGVHDRWGLSCGGSRRVPDPA